MVLLIRGLFQVMPSFLTANFLISVLKRRTKYRMRPEEAAWMEKTEVIEFGEGLKARKLGKGPVVVLVHGWGGAAAQWYKMAEAIAGLGFTVIAPDISGHGDSGGDTITFRNFYKDLRKLADHIGTGIYAYVGHSAGGLTMMAGRSLEGLYAQKYVCIAAPSHPYPPVKVIRERLSPPESVLGKLRAYLSEQFQCKWDEIPGMSFHNKPGDDLLLVYDVNDKYLYDGEVENIKKFSPGAESLVTTDSGHEQLLRSDACIERVCTFLK